MVIGTRCSAAEGLSSLAVRENSRTVDRIAILGNLCNFKVRLDTERLEQENYSFSTSAFALAALNGDLSLMHCLPPRDPVQVAASESGSIAYDQGTIPVRASIEAVHVGYSWDPPHNGTLTNPEWVPEDSNPKRLVQSTLTEEGLSTFGWIFLCDLFIDTSPVQFAFKNEWERVRSAEPLAKLGHSNLCIRVVWNLVRLLILKGYLHLAQVVWSHENDLHLVDCTSTGEDSTKVPVDIRELLDTKSLRFIFQKEPSISCEHALLAKLAPKKGVAEVASSNRAWLAEAVMSGKILCGRQINTGISLPPQSAMMSFSTMNGKLEVIHGADSGPYDTVPCTREAEDLVPGTTNPKSKYLSIFESEAANMKCAFTPALQHRLDAAQSPHTWRPQHCVAKRIFKGSAGDFWEVEGGHLTRGFVVPTTMFSNCVLV